MLLDKRDWVIIANGMPVPTKHLQQALKGKWVLALDGAADHLKSLAIHPDVILGDFDSIEDRNYWGVIEGAEQPYTGRFKVLIVPANDQTFTDLEKGIRHCDQTGAKSIVILNATGGRIDHTLNNIGLLRKCHDSNRPLSLETERERIEYLKDGSTVIRGEIGDPCAIMGYPEALMTTHGLTYNTHNFLLRLGISESTSNQLAEKEAHLSIQGEALVIHPFYTETHLTP